MFVAQVRGDIEGCLKIVCGREERERARENEMARRLSRMYGGARNEETWKFVQHFILKTQRSLENRYTPK